MLLGRSLRLVEVLDEHDLVSRLVVDQFIDKGSRDRQSQPARPDALLFADDGMAQRIVFGVADRRMPQTIDIEALTRIGNAIEQHSPRTKVRDANLAGAIQLTAPLDGVRQQL